MSQRPEARIVLVRTLYDRNIGSVSRVMSNTGLKDLILINPGCEITESAREAAATGQEALQSHRVYSGWSSYLESESPGLRIGLTTRAGRGRDVRDLALLLPTLGDRFESIDFIFGPEHWGLSNEDLDNVHFAASLPVFGENTSYNLSHAVLLCLYLYHTAMAQTQVDGEIQQVVKETAKLPEKPANRFPDETVRLWLETLGFDTRRTGTSVFTVIRRLLLHAVPTEKEIRTLEVILHQSIRKMREYNWLRRQGLTPPKFSVSETPSEGPAYAPNPDVDPGVTAPQRSPGPDRSTH